MTQLGLPVPPGFVITTQACKLFFENGNHPPEGLMDDVNAHMHKLESLTGKKFGDPGNPLLVSVRSGAAVSMPGMMDTILNLGLNDATVTGLAVVGADPAFAAGVLFSRNPATGEPALYGDVMFGAQGEDVVAGDHRTQPLAALKARLAAVGAPPRDHAAAP